MVIRNALTQYLKWVGHMGLVAGPSMPDGALAHRAAPWADAPWADMHPRLGDPTPHRTSLRLSGPPETYLPTDETTSRRSGVPLSCFLDSAELFGLGRPYDLADLARSPRRDPLIPCDEWQRRTSIGER